MDCDLSAGWTFGSFGNPEDADNMPGKSKNYIFHSNKAMASQRKSRYNASEESGREKTLK